MTTKQAILWTAFWVSASFGFNLGIYHYAGTDKASEFMNVYMVEKLLSFDNLFVFLMIFNYFGVPEKERRRVLNWGIGGAIILRAIFIVVGVSVVQQFHWLLYALGAVLIYSAWGIAFSDGDDNVEESRIVKFANSLSASPFLMWIIAIELSDIAFAIDSIPASLAISQDMMIVYTANIFAILGLRSFYFVIQSLYDHLPKIKYGVSLILAFIGVKMFLPLLDLHIQSSHSLMVVVGILVANISIIMINRKNIRG